MLRPITGALLCAMLAFSVAVGDEFSAQVIRLKDGKATIARAPLPTEARKALGRRVLDLSVDPECRVFRGKYNETTRKYERGDELPGGIGNEQVTTLLQRLPAQDSRREAAESKGRSLQRGFVADVVTDEGGKSIKEIILHFIPKPSDNSDRQRPKNMEVQKAETVSNLSPKDLASFEFVMMGLKASRDRLASGVFRTYGIHTDLLKPTELRANIDFFCAFDRLQNRVRFDRSLASDPRLLQNRPHSSGPVVRSPLLLHQKIKAVFTPQQSLMTGSGGNVVIYPPDSPAVPVRAFDIRALGFYYWGGFQRGISLDRIYNMLTTNKPREIQRDSRGCWKVVWEFKKPVWSEDTVWIDETRGFTVIRGETRFARGTGTDVTWEPKSSNTVSWSQHDDLWLPESFKIEDITKRGTRSFELAFEWESFNKPIPDELFTVDGLAKEPKRVYDGTKGPLVLVKGRSESKQRTVGNRLSAGKNHSLRWFVATNSVFLVVVILCLYLRRRFAGSRGFT